MAAKRKMSTCDQRAANRAAQQKYQSKLPKGTQSKRVQKSQAKASTKADGGKTPGTGKHGSTQGRPRKNC